MCTGVWLKSLLNWLMTTAPSAKIVVLNVLSNSCGRALPLAAVTDVVSLTSNVVPNARPGLTMRRGERVRWYLMGMGTEVDLHTPHWHGNTVLIDGHRKDVTELFPATLEVADMRPDDAGTWLYHCHVGDHITAGMLALYNVTP